MRYIDNIYIHILRDWYITLHLNQHIDCCNYAIEYKTLKN